MYLFLSAMQNTFNKELQAKGCFEQKHLRGEYLPGDLRVISSLARQPGGYYIRAVLDWTRKRERTFFRQRCKLRSIRNCMERGVLSENQLRGEYLPGDLGVISSLAGYPGGYHLRAVLNCLFKTESIATN